MVSYCGGLCREEQTYCMKERVEKLRKLLSDNRLDGALITGLTAIRYYSGFTSDEAALVVTMDHASLLTDFRYTIQAREQSPDFEVVETGRGNLIPDVDKLLKADKCRRVAFEERTMTVATFEKYKALDFEFVPFSEEMNKPRLFKTADEVASLQRAQNMADEGFKILLSRIGSGMTEKEVAAELDYINAKLGSECPSFDTIVGSGPNGAMCHAIPGDRRLQKGDLVVLDYGCVYNGYHSDMTRTFAVGEVDDFSKRIYDIVLTAQQKALDALKGGITGKALDAIARDYIASQGYGETFGHSLGHGFGLMIHEAPNASTVSEWTLEPGMTITVEPGIYIEGRLGVRIEDCCVVTETGKIDLVSSTKELLSVD